jgi:hypothetical protein
MQLVNLKEKEKKGKGKDIKGKEKDERKLFLSEFF